MTVRVGVIGTGMIGQDHIRRITQVLSGGKVVAVSDVDAARAGQVAAGLPAATVHPTGQDLIAHGGVDAVLVASWGAAHEEHVLAAISAGKPVFCEKPLAPTEEACLRIVEAEMAAGRRLVQVGFMRRYDAGYHALKAALEAGEIGAPLLMHCAHRNPSVPPYGFTTEMMVSDSAVHEIDLVRWLFSEDIVATNILKPRRSSKGSAELHDPLIVLLEMASGVLVDVEVFVNATYGYDIRGEIVGEPCRRGSREIDRMSADAFAVPRSRFVWERKRTGAVRRPGISGERAKQFRGGCGWAGVKTAGAGQP